ncbi:unnamed protein product [Protopolystoma xenopodis]|uniref:Uncharacterized protein n=1 Tax=Protopolystoma xenopodis TaxID=117903 RepID=A0A448WGV7_9PLAT|nr:unnamed protein product [Protopolystoma xenopodis]
MSGAETALGRYLALSSSGASTAASSDVDDPPPAQTVPRIHKHRPPRLDPRTVRDALLGALPEEEEGNRRCLDGDSDSNEEEIEEILDISQKSNCQDSEDEQYDLDAANELVIHASRSMRRRVHRRALPEVLAEENESDYDDDDFDFGNMNEHLSDGEMPEDDGEVKFPKLIPSKKRADEATDDSIKNKNLRRKKRREAQVGISIYFCIRRYPLILFVSVLFLPIKS